jgi:hypothetical protein
MNDATRLTRKEQAQRNKHQRKARDAARSAERAHAAGDGERETRARARQERHQRGAEGQPAK